MSASTPTVAALPSILMRTSNDITSALHTLYRSHDFLKQAAVQRLTRTRDRLSSLSSTTESATHRILDGLDNALLLIDELGRAPLMDMAEAEAVHSRLREDFHGLITALQFQDIVAQQIAFAVHVLEDTESRIQGLAEHLETVFGKATPSAEAVETDGPFDPGASPLKGPERQALADSIFDVAAARRD